MEDDYAFSCVKVVFFKSVMEEGSIYEIEVPGYFCCGHEMMWSVLRDCIPGKECDACTDYKVKVQTECLFKLITKHTAYFLPFVMQLRRDNLLQEKSVMRTVERQKQWVKELQNAGKTVEDAIEISEDSEQFDEDGFITFINELVNEESTDLLTQEDDENDPEDFEY